MIKKISVLLLCITMVVCSFVSCEHDPVSQETTQTTVEETNELSTSNERLAPDIPEGTNFENYTFTIVTRGKVNSVWYSEDIYSEGLTGDPLNDAVYSRNKKIEQDLNITIVEYPCTTASNAAQFNLALTAAQSQDDSYDLICMGVKDNLTGLVNRGLLMDLNNIPYMDLTKEYYDQNSIADLSILNKNYFVMGDMLTMDNDATRCICFNKQIATDIGITTEYGKDIYNLVSDGEWTMDIMYEMAQLAASDINGNAIMEAAVDRWGILTEPFNSLAMINSAGGRLVSKDEDDIPYYSANNEISISVLQAIIPIQSDTNCVMLTTTVTGYTGSVTDFMLKTFESNNALFYNGQLQNAKMFRKQDVDFGIIPNPKYTANQTSYYSPVTTYGSNCIAIPVQASNYERTGIIVEALSCESKYTVQPAYYDIVIIGKTLQDQQSISMLDIILSNRLFDLGYTFNWGGSYSMICSLTTSNRVSSVSSSLASIEESTRTAIAQTLAMIEE